MYRVHDRDFPQTYRELKRKTLFKTMLRVPTQHAKGHRQWKPASMQESRPNTCVGEGKVASKEAATFRHKHHVVRRSSTHGPRHKSTRQSTRLAQTANQILNVTTPRCRLSDGAHNCGWVLPREGVRLSQALADQHGLVCNVLRDFRSKTFQSMTTRYYTS